MKKTNHTNYMTLKYLKEIEESDLDIIEVEKTLGKDAWEPGYERIFKHLDNDCSWEGECNRISIDLLEKTIAKLKKAGANYVEMMHHSDHNAYVFYGIEVRKSTKEEVLTYQLQNEKKKRIENRLEELDKEKKELSDEWRKI